MPERISSATQRRLVGDVGVCVVGSVGDEDAMNRRPHRLYCKRRPQRSRAGSRPCPSRATTTKVVPRTVFARETTSTSWFKWIRSPNGRSRSRSSALSSYASKMGRSKTTSNSSFRELGRAHSVWVSGEERIARSSRRCARDRSVSIHGFRRRHRFLDRCGPVGLRLVFSLNKRIRTEQLCIRKKIAATPRRARGLPR